MNPLLNYRVSGWCFTFRGWTNLRGQFVTMFMVPTKGAAKTHINRNISRQTSGKKAGSMKVKLFCHFSPWPRYRTIQTHPDRYTTLGQCPQGWWCSFQSRGFCLLPRHSPQFWPNHGNECSKLHLYMWYAVIYERVLWFIVYQLRMGKDDWSFWICTYTVVQSPR